LASGWDSGVVKSATKLVTSLRAFKDHSFDDHVHTSLGLSLVHALLSKAPLISGNDPGSGQWMKPPVVLRRDEVQGSAVQPRDEQRAAHAQSVIDIGRLQIRGAAPDGKTEATFVLSLNCEETADDFHGRSGGRACEQLGSETSESGILGFAHPAHRPPKSRCVGFQLLHKPWPTARTGSGSSTAGAKQRLG